ncbi:hypothetical protein [Tumebacillus lipolyticus]|uniref:Uncharacterized protein n=1 Tax=Tumebacillus lipolyticus TaxID=1280370 RepID=A0ABW5A4E1_9BACL
MKKYWLSIALGAIAALALQTGSASFATSDSTVAGDALTNGQSSSTPVVAELYPIDPWAGIIKQG